MEKIQEIIFLPSLRCNLNCKHCGEIQDVRKDQEVDCRMVLQQMERSILLEKSLTISVSGGEPFLNPTFVSFLSEGVRRTDFCFHITTNGYYYQDIKRLAESISLSGGGMKQLMFHVSIDGLEKNHNKIRRNCQSFQNAVQSVRILAASKIPVSINTVMQMDNVDELEAVKKYFQSISPFITVQFIPFATDIGEEKSNPYTREYMERAWHYAQTNLDKKRILSGGHYGVERCHAGEKNIVIGAEGNVYACLTGAYYKDSCERESFCYGNLKENTLDEILSDDSGRKKVYETSVRRCKGCTNPCEVNREVHIFGQKPHLSDDEIDTANDLEKELRLGVSLLDYSGWHSIERYTDGSCLCWSSMADAKIFVPVGNQHILKICYRKLNLKSVIKILINGTEAFVDREETVQRTVLLEMPFFGEEKYVTITFLIDQLWSPAELLGSSDGRMLGVGLESVQYEKELGGNRSGFDKKFWKIRLEQASWS